MRARRSRLLSAVLAACLAAAVTLRAQAPATPPQDEIVTAPVEVDGVVLFRLRGVTSFPAEQRAAIIRDRIVSVANDPAISVESIRSVEGDGATRILAGEQVITTVLDADANLEQIPRPQLAAGHLARIREAIILHRRERSPEALRRDAISALIATAVFAGLIMLLRLVWRRVDRFLVARLQKRIQTVEIKSFELMRAERIWDAVRGIIFAIRTIVYLLVGLSYLGWVLSEFPWTRFAARSMREFALGPLRIIGNGIVVNIPSLVFLVVLFVMVRLLLRLIYLSSTRSAAVP